MRPLARRSVLAATTALLIAGLGGAILARAQSAPPANGITVTGQGSASLPPDKAIVNGSVLTNADTAADALAQNAQAAQAVVAAAKSAVGDQGTVQTTSINVYPQYSAPQPYTPGAPTPTPGPPQIVGYQATTGIEVTTTQLDKLGDLVQALVNAGLNQLGGVQFTLQNPEQLRVQALQAAIDDATTQAQAAAAQLGVALGAVVNVQVGYSSAPPPTYAPAPPPPTAAARPAGVGAVPIVAPGPLSATTSVTITFAIATPTPAP